jgi:hypothetical protein
MAQSCSDTLQTAIADVLATSDHKRQEVVKEWPHIATALKTYKLNLGNRIAPKTFEASYERYLNVVLVHLKGLDRHRLTWRRLCLLCQASAIYEFDLSQDLWWHFAPEQSPTP